MVNVAKDPGIRDAELPSAASPAPHALVGGMSLEAVLAVPCLAGAQLVGATGEGHRAVVRSSLLGDGRSPLRHLVCTAADDLTARESGGCDPVTDAAARGVSALVVTGASAAQARRWGRSAAQAGLPLVLPRGPGGPDLVVTQVLDALLDHQSGILERVDEAHEILVGVVLAGGGLEDLCERLAGFLGGAAMVTTSDGRVLARAGSEPDLAAALALGCFDRTGRLITEQEPVGPRPAQGSDPGRAMVRIVAGPLDHGLLAAFVRDRPLTADDVRLLERAATVAALAITKEQAVSAVESKYRAEFLRDALAGRAGAAPEAIAHADSLAGTSTGGSWSWWPRRTRTTTTRHAPPTRWPRCSNASRAPGDRRWRSATRGRR